MIRPVWHVTRYRETDTSETLQSDVMRFMAILALCLVAIFALVQSLPLRPVEPVPDAAPTPLDASSQPIREPAAEEPKIDSPPFVPEPVVQTSPEPREKIPAPAPKPLPIPEPPKQAPQPQREVVAIPRSEPQVVRAERPNKKPRTKTAQPEPVIAETPQLPPAPEPVAPQRAEAPKNPPDFMGQEGLLLRFDSDAALLALVTKRQVSVYAWVRNAAWRLSSERGVLRFTSATAPRRFHNMTPDTVPSAVVLALHTAAATAGAADKVTWGVTLPTGISRQLEPLADKHANGTLVIHANGRVRYRSAG